MITDDVLISSAPTVTIIATLARSPGGIERTWSCFWPPESWQMRSPFQALDQIRWESSVQKPVRPIDLAVRPHTDQGDQQVLHCYGCRGHPVLGRCFGACRVEHGLEGHW